MTFWVHGLQYIRLPVVHHLAKLMSIESVTLSNCLILCPLLILLPSIFPSITVFSSELAFALAGQSTGVSVSVLPMSIQDWFPLGLTGLISLLSKGVAVKSLLTWLIFVVVVVHSVIPNSLWPQGLQHARLLCPSLSPGACSNSCPLSWWCCPTISSSAVPFSSCLQSFPASGSFPMSQFLASGGQSIGASVSVLPMNIRDWFPLGLTGLISLQFKGLSCNKARFLSFC